MTAGSASNANWVYDSPIHSDVEAKLRRFLVECGNADKILGIQVCAYKDRKVIIDTAAGVMGKDDPRPVQLDSLFPVFSATKGITAGMIHWLADKGKVKLDETVANILPSFGTNGKHQIKVHHILNHTAGLQNALAGVTEDSTLCCDYDECLKRIGMAAPETEPGSQQLYHYLSYGWPCGGIIENASGKKFQDVLEEAFVRPLNVEGEFYIGIPHGVESRLASVTIDENELIYLVKLLESNPLLPPIVSFSEVSSLLTISNTLDYRRSLVPAGNGNFSARALARYYATLGDGGVVPPRYSSSVPPLGSHPHHPTFSSEKHSDTNQETNATSDAIETKIFSNTKTKIPDAFIGSGDYKDLIIPNGRFGLGFERFTSMDNIVIGFGHSGIGGSVGYCDINNRFAISVTINKLSTGALTAEVMRFVLSELDLPVPIDYAPR